MLVLEVNCFFAKNFQYILEEFPAQMCIRLSRDQNHDVGSYLLHNDILNLQ